MKLISIYFLTVLCCISLIVSCKKTEKKELNTSESQWVQLFNGKDLKDWVVKIKGHPLHENYKNTFRAVNGVLQVNYDNYDTFDNSFGHIFYINEYSNYKLRLQYRFFGEQVKGGEEWAKKNSGVMIHSQAPESMGLNQDFPVSIEVQLLGGLASEERPTGNVCTPGTHIVLNDETVTSHCINSTSKTFHNDQWVNLEVLVQNDSIISHKINGETVITYYKAQVGGAIDIDKETWEEREGLPLKSGYISLQSESHPIEFKNIELLILQ